MLVLPQEVWIDITRYLGPQDLFQLRLCCKRLNQIVSSRAIWKPRCYEKWLEHQLHDVLNTHRDEHRDWFYYYRFRNRIDRHVLNLLIKITQVTDTDEYTKLFENVLRYNPSHLIPLFHKITSKATEGETEGATLELVTLCQRLLNTLRHKHVYDLLRIEEKSTPTFVHNAEETFFLPLAAMDPSFDRLLHFRQDMFAQIHALIKQEFEDLDDFFRLPATLKVDKLICFLTEVLNIFKTDRHFFLEDFMLLRIYAGETTGHPLVILSIIQSLASQYAVETILCGSYLIISDARLRDGESYLTLSSTGVPKIFTRKRLVQSLKRIVGSSDYIIQREIMPTILQPLKYQTLLATIFKELLPLYSRSKWSASPMKTMEKARGMFPYSNQPMNSETVRYFLCVYKAVEMRLRLESQVSVLFTIAHKQVFALVSRLFPEDSTYLNKLLKCDGKDFGEIRYNYEDWILHLHNIPLEKSDALGLFVMSPRDRQLMCVVGTKKIGNDETYYTLMNFIGEFYVELRQNLEVFDVENNEHCIENFLSLAAQSDLGLVFTNFDWQQKKLITNAKVLHILATQD